MTVNNLVLGTMCVNCYILSDEATGSAVIIDAPDEAKTIFNFVNANGYKVTNIIMTHCHFDHILALKELKELTGANICTHTNGKDFLVSGEKNLCSYQGIPWSPLTADKYLEDGDSIFVGETELKVLHTPGHTSDSICLLGNKILISGDTLFCGSVGRTDFPTGDMNLEISSIKEKLLTLPDDTRVYPGHGGITTIGAERKGNPYLR